MLQTKCPLYVRKTVWETCATSMKQVLQSIDQVAKMEAAAATGASLAAGAKASAKADASGIGLLTTINAQVCLCCAYVCSHLI